MRVYRFLPKDSTTLGALESITPPDVIICSLVRGLLDSRAITLCHGVPPALQKLPL